MMLLYESFWCCYAQYESFFLSSASVEQPQQTGEGCVDSGRKDMDVPSLLSSLQAYVFVHKVSDFSQANVVFLAVGDLE